MKDTQAMAAIAALNRMFDSGHFSICTIDRIAEMLRVEPDAEAYALLRTLHCVDWNKMPRELRRRVPALIQQALSGEPRFRFELAQEPAETSALTVIDGSPHTRRPLLKRIFGGDA